MTFGSGSWFTDAKIKENFKRIDMERQAKDDHARRNILLLHTIRNLLAHRNLTAEDFDELVNTFHPKEE